MTTETVNPDVTSWKPPYCANDTDLACPRCNAEDAVCVREHSHYTDTDCIEAYCSECHVKLEVQVSVEITFSDPEEVTP